MNKLHACLFAVSLAIAADKTPTNNPQNLQPVKLNIIATDRNGDPVADLRPADLRVVDDAAQQQVISLRPNQLQKPQPIVVLFDLLDLSIQVRGTIAERLRRALPDVPSSTPLYLYFLGTNGSVYPIIPASGANSEIALDPDRGQRLGPLLDRAMKQLAQTTRVDLNQPMEQVKIRFAAMAVMDQNMKQLDGRKQLLWITYGVPSSIRLQEGWFDATPYLRQLAAAFNRDNTAIYTVDPGLRPATLKQDGLAVISEATGGREFESVDLGMVLSKLRIDGLASYVLEYGPPMNDNWQNKFHRVKVSCDRKGVHLLTQQVYLAAAR